MTLETRQAKKSIKTVIARNGWKTFTFMQIKHALNIKKSDNSMSHIVANALDAMEREGIIRRIAEKHNLKHFRYNVIKMF